MIRSTTHTGNHPHEGIELGDGSTHRFGAVTALLAEDTAGHGHTILIVDGEPMIRAAISLAEMELR